MVAGKVDHGDSLSLWINGTNIGVVTKIDDKAEAFESCALEEITIPRLRSS